MDDLKIHETLEVKLPTMVVAFAGWPDAAEAATRALRYMARRLPAKKFAEIDPEQFFDFTIVRPQTRINRRGERVIRWPSNEFFYWTGEDGSNGLLIFIGTEPSLRWRTFSNLLVDVAQRFGVSLVVSIGALLDAIPHTRDPKVTGRATSEEMRQKVEWLGIQGSGYQGPTGIHTAFWDALNERDIEHASIWGHSPHYVQSSPNPKVSYALLTRLKSLVDFDVDLAELHLAGEAFEEEINKVVAKEQELSTYVARLEQRYDTSVEPTGEIPNPEDMVQELEDFLKRQRQKPNQDEPHNS